MLLHRVLTVQMYAASDITDTQLEFSLVQESIFADESKTEGSNTVQ